MALSASTVWEVRTGGNDTNGGGFTTGAAGTDYSQQNAKNTVGADISTIDGVGNGTSTFTSATANFGATIVGNVIYLQGGTGGLAASRYRVTARASTTSITLDRNVAAGTGITMNIGGAVASLGILGSTTATILVSGHIIWIEAGTYVVTSATPNISDGCFSTALSVQIEGYQTVRGDLGTKPLIQSDGTITTFTLITAGSLVCKLRNLDLDGNNRTSSRGITASNALFVYRVIGRNFTNSAFVGTINCASFIECMATGCSTQPAFLNCNCYGCVAHTNTVTGFSVIAGTPTVRCISYNNSGATSDGFVTTVTAGGYFINCVAYGNGRDGFRFPNISGSAINCIAESNTGIGFDSSANAGTTFNTCAAFGNTGGDFFLNAAVFTDNRNPITGVSSFFTNAAAGDFSLNNTTGAGAVARTFGIPTLFPDGLTTEYLDIGAAQHQDTGGGGGEYSTVF